MNKENKQMCNNGTRNSGLRTQDSGLRTQDSGLRTQEKRGNLAKKMKLLAMVFWVCLTGVSWGQTPGVVLTAKSYNLASDLNTPYSSDWLLSVAEDNQGNFVSCGYSGGYWSGVEPVILLTDEKLNKVNHNTPRTAAHSFVDPGNSNTAFNLLGSSGAFSEVICTQSNYIAAGAGSVTVSGVGTKKAIVTAISNDFNTKTNYVFFTSGPFASSTIYARCITSYVDPVTSSIYYFAAGVKDGEWFLFMLDDQMNVVNNWVIINPNSSLALVGDVRSLCVGYPSGTEYNNKPANATQAANRLVLCGYAQDPNNSSNLNSYLVSINFSALFDNGGGTGVANVEFIDEFDSEPTYGNPSLYDATFPKDVSNPASKWPCWQQYYIRNGDISYNGVVINDHAVDDWGVDVKQDINGDFVQTIMANYVRFGGHHGSTGSIEINHDLYHNEIDERVPDDLYTGQLILKAYSPDPANVNNLVLQTQYHVGHASGLDYANRIAFDHNNDMYISSSTGDKDKALLLKNSTTTDYVANFMLHKLELNKSTWTFGLLWDKVFLGGADATTDQSGRGCGFDVAVTRNNNVVFVGDNQNNYDPVNDPNDDDFDLVLIKNDCIQSTLTPPLIDIGPNDPSNPGEFSVQTRLNGVGNTYTWGGNHIVGARVVVEDGYTLRIAYGAEIQFLDINELGDRYADFSGYIADVGDVSIIVNPGGKLEVMDGAHLTNLKNTGCDDSWGGVYLAAQVNSATDAANMTLKNSTISNAKTGVKNRGVLSAINTVSGSQNYQNIPNGGILNANFLNNRVSVDSRKLSGAFTEPETYFYLQNFACTDRIPGHSLGLDYFIRLNAGELSQNQVKGCLFTNTYFNNLGMCAGISAFNSQVDVMFADLDPMNTGLCHPNMWRPSSFEGLYTAIRHGSPSQHPQARLRVMEADFKNNKEAIIDGAGRDNVIYKNNINWDNAYPFMSNNDYKLGVFNSWAYSTKIYENIITNDNNSRDFIALYTNQNAWDPSLGGHNVKGNSITNLGPNNLGIGHQFDGDNSHLQVSCNSYSGLSTAWLVNGPLEDQGQVTPAASNSNSWDACTGNTNILANFGFTYNYGTTDNPGSFSCNPGVRLNSIINDAPCVIIDPCSLYSHASGGEGSGDWDIDAMADISDQEKMVDDFFRGNYASVSATLSELSFTDQYEDLDKVINAVLPAFQSGRGFTLNGGERAFLRNYAVGTSYTNMIANDILFFFADERVTQEFLVPSGGASSAPSSETAAIISLQAQHAVSIYPNPAKHTIRIIVTGDNSYTGEILDVQGKVMMHINSGEGNTIDISSLSAGMYFMRVQAGDVSELHKLLVR